MTRVLDADRREVHAAGRVARRPLLALKDF